MKVIKNKSQMNLRVPNESSFSLKTFVPSFGLLVLYLFSMYKIIYFCVDRYQDYLDTTMGKYNMVYIPYSISALLVAFFYTALYFFDDVYTHKFKINDQPWPWQQDSKKWRKMLLDIFYVCVILFPLKIRIKKNIIFSNC